MMMINKKYNEMRYNNAYLANLVCSNQTVCRAFSVIAIAQQQCHTRVQ